MAGQWVQPVHPSDQVTIHPNGRFAGQSLLWYRGDEPFRLGWPRQPGDAPQRQVPAWKVSSVGLSLEQPTTYFGGGADGFSMIQMSAYAPHLLRVYQHTRQPLIRAFARNSIIGRFTNYPGYYVNGYTDLHQAADYPYTGPDVTSIYYHHIPVHLAFTLDWLFTEAQVRSDNRIRFPFVRQHRYVWFHSRLFGHAPGQVFEDAAALPRLDPKLVVVEQPEVNHLLARGRDRWWVILMNDAQHAVQADVRIAAEGGGLRMGAEYASHDAQGNIIGHGILTEQLRHEVPAQGLIALALPAQVSEPAPPPMLSEGRLERELDPTWGRLHAFRIRGPFGNDSLYVFATGRPPGGRVTLQLDGDTQGSRVDTDYPYEFSIYPWAMQTDMTFRLTLEAPDGSTVRTESMTLPGSKATEGGAR